MLHWIEWWQGPILRSHLRAQNSPGWLKRWVCSRGRLMALCRRHRRQHQRRQRPWDAFATLACGRTGVASRPVRGSIRPGRRERLLAGPGFAGETSPASSTQARMCPVWLRTAGSSEKPGRGRRQGPRGRRTSWSGCDSGCARRRLSSLCCRGGRRSTTTTTTTIPHHQPEGFRNSLCQ